MSRKSGQTYFPLKTQFVTHFKQKQKKTSQTPLKLYKLIYQPKKPRKQF
jgi:hypothetical protein